MLTILTLILKYTEKFLIILIYLSVPFIFALLFGYFKTKTNDIHIIVDMVNSLLLFVNINILYFILISKINEMLKILKKKKK